MSSVALNGADNLVSLELDGSLLSADSGTFTVDASSLTEVHTQLRP